MEKKFTQGEWSISENSYHPGLYDQIIKCGKHIIGILRGNDIKTKSNAKLIAAAPDLLEALEDLYNAIDSCVELTPDVLRKADKAIKKALE